MPKPLSYQLQDGCWNCDMSHEIHDLYENGTILVCTADLTKEERPVALKDALIVKDEIKDVIVLPHGYCHTWGMK